MSFGMLVYFLELLLLLSYGLAYTGYFAKANAGQEKHSILLTRLVAYSDYIVKYGAAEMKEGVILSHKIDESKLATLTCWSERSEIGFRLIAKSSATELPIALMAGAPTPEPQGSSMKARVAPTCHPNPKLETALAAGGLNLSINGVGICIQRLVIRAGEINTLEVCADA